MKSLVLASVLSLLALPALAETAEDILGPAEPLQTDSSFSGSMLEDDSEVLTPIGIMNEDMFAAIQPAAGPEISPTAISPTDTAAPPSQTTPPPSEISVTTP